MRFNPYHARGDADDVRQLIRANPWGTLVSHHAGELVASHYPVLLDEDVDGLAIVTHVGRPDDELHGFSDREILLIVQGRNGYISPSWYAPGATPAPTWNFTVAHCYGVPQLLGEEENLRVLTRLVEHFERHVEEPMLLDQEWGAPVARGTVGIRLPISRFVFKRKLSQDKDPVSRRRVIAALRADGPYLAPGAGRRDGARAPLGGGRVDVKRPHAGRFTSRLTTDGGGTGTAPDRSRPPIHRPGHAPAALDLAQPAIATCSTSRSSGLPTAVGR